MATTGGEHIGVAPVRLIVESITRVLRCTLPVSVRMNGFRGVTGVCLSLPAAIGRNGVHLVLNPDLDHLEQDAFRRCAEAVRNTLAGMG